MTKPCGDGDEKPERMTAGSLKQQAQAMSALALTTLGKIMEGTGQDSAKLGAAREILDRGHGKPKPAPKPRSRPAAAKGGMTVIVKRFTDITPEEQAAADATERTEW